MLRFLLFWVLLSPSLFAESKYDAPHPATVDLISEDISLHEFPQGIAVRFRLKPGWHVYWKNPGDSGTPPKVNWRLPEGVTISEWVWPTPDRISVPPLMNFGYEKEVLFISELHAPKEMQEATVNADVSWLVCKESCIPGKKSVSLTLKRGPNAATEEVTAFQRTRHDYPQKFREWKIQAKTTPGQLHLIIDGSRPVKGDIAFFPEANDLIQNAAPQKMIWTQNRGEMMIPWETQRTEAPREVKGLLVAANLWPSEKARAWDFTTLVTPGEATAGSSNPVIANTIETEAPAMAMILQMLFFAFVGGMILNLMPCVFPILSIKILSFVQQAGHSKKMLRLHGWFFALGVVASDLVLAGALIALRAGGKTLGWGFQLQSPYFVLGLIVLMFLLALSLLGLFEIGDRLAGLGSGLTAKEGYRGSFFSGVLAMIVATPCTAPFMGSAVGFALTQPAWISLSVFAALGVGMATPYLLLCYSPGLLKYLPRPGLWMEQLKQLMAFPLFATVIWLAWVFGQQTGMDGIARLLFALLSLGLAVWLLSLGKKRRKKSPLAIFFALLALLASGYFAQTALHSKAPEANPSATTENGIQWEVYSEEKLISYTAKGTPVFIDFTAAWCVTCQVNEKVVFSSAEVRDWFRTLGIITMKADWTNGEDHITKKLAEFGRSGVPTYLLYGKTPNSAPKLLPEVLSPGIVLDAISKL